MRVAGTRGKRRVVSLLLVLLLAHLLLLLLLLLLLHRDNSPSSPTAAATGQTTTTTTTTPPLSHSRIPGSPTVEGSPCVGVAGGRKWAWQPVYTVVIDAGATATRAHIFSFLRCCLDNTFMLQNEDYFHQDDTILRYVNASSQMRYLLMPLLRRARSVVPPEYLPHTPLLVRATPSLRLLPRPDATILIHTARKIVTRSGFLVRRGHVTIMAGHDEAADLWLAANFLTGRMYKNGSSPVATADLGGGTLQVTIPLKGPPEHIKKAILERRIKGDNQQEKGKPKEGPVRSEDINKLKVEKGASVKGQNKTTSDYGREIKSRKHIDKENGERRVSVSVNRRLKNNLNNNSSHGRTVNVAEGGVSDEDAQDGVLSVKVQETETRRNISDSESKISNSRKINGTAESATTPDPSDGTKESILYVTAADFEFRTPPPKRNEEQRGSDTQIETTSASRSGTSPTGPILMHNMTTLLPPSRTKNRMGWKRKGQGQEEKAEPPLGRTPTQSITEASRTSQDTFAFDVLPSSDTKNPAHIRPRGKGRKSNVSPDERRRSRTQKINSTSAKETKRRRQKGRERMPVEGKKGKVGKRRSQRGEVDKRDDQVPKRGKSSPSHRASSTSIPIDRSAAENNGHQRAFAIDDKTDHFSSRLKPPQPNQTSQRRNQRKRKLKKPTRRKQRTDDGREPRGNGSQSEKKKKKKNGPRQEDQHIRQTSISARDRQATREVSISSLHEGDLGSDSNPLNVGRGSVSDHQGSSEMSPTISLETSTDFTKDEEEGGGEPRRPDLPVVGSIPIDKNDPSTGESYRRADSNLNIHEPLSSATREPNLEGNYTSRQRGSSRRGKTPNPRIKTSKGTLPQELPGSRWGLLGGEHEPPSADSVAKHSLVRLNLRRESRQEKKTFRNVSIYGKEEGKERLVDDTRSALNASSTIHPLSTNTQQPKMTETAPILGDKEQTHFTNTDDDDESPPNSPYATTKINNHRSLSLDNDILGTRNNGTFLTKGEETVARADNDTRGPIYAAAEEERQTPTHATRGKNQSRSITRKDRRRQPQSPLQIGEAAAATTENTLGRAKDDNNSPGGIFADVQSPQGVRTSRQRHRHRHRHSHRKKDRGTEAFLRRKRNILEGKLALLGRRADKRYEGESHEHYSLAHKAHHIFEGNRHRKGRMIFNNEYIIPTKNDFINRFISYKGDNLLGQWINEKYDQMCKFSSVRQCKSLLYNEIMSRSYYERSVQKLTKYMRNRRGAMNEIKLFILSTVNQRKKQRETNNVIVNGGRYQNIPHGRKVNAKINDIPPSGGERYSDEPVNTTEPPRQQRNYKENFAEVVDAGFRTKRELRNLFDAPNITYRCSPSQKYWLFASSVAMGIYPARVKVLQSGDILMISPTSKDSITTPSPPVATTPRHRSDIPLEEVYPELTAGYDDVDLSEPEGHVTEAGVPVPSPPPPPPPPLPSAVPTRSPVPSQSPSRPPMKITSEWMEETLSKVKKVVDSILKAIGSREVYVKDANDDGTATRIDVDIPHKNPALGPPPSRGPPGTIPRRRRPGRKGVSRRRKPIGGGMEGTTESHVRGISDNDTITMTRRESNSVEDRHKIPDHGLDTTEGDRGSLNEVHADDVSVNRTLNLSQKVPLDVSNSALPSQSVPIVDPSSITVPSNSTSSIISEDLDLVRSDLAVNHSSVGNLSDISSNNSEAPNGAPSSKKTLSSVTDLLFTVPNERVINPAEDSQVKSEIKSTEKLIRTSWEDFLFRVPGSKQHPDSETDGTRIQNSTMTDGLRHENSSSEAIRSELEDKEHSTHSTQSQGRKEPALATSQKDAIIDEETPKDSIENKAPVPTSQAIENELLKGDPSIQTPDLILQTACLPVGSIGRFKMQDVTYLVTGLGAGTEGEDCWREVSKVVKEHIKLPSLNHTTLLATTAFYFVAANANLIEPDMAYGFVRVEQFRLAANTMCSRRAEELPDPLACLDYQYIAALLSHGLQLPDHTEILVCEKIHGFRLGWALGAALNYLQKH
ncbi:LOW QUALITY PROTEIN: uncharacterized protein LOC135196325 [Macrobrachium nipponense]|uniref:LOW QUALITY PROTEIN: uncharacterized protein LOC135196325 n=1 Tax=Macrobrachium nipponense TaxID=159736 RepID=UPI0030C81725